MKTCAIIPALDIDLADDLQRIMFERVCSEYQKIFDRIIIISKKILIKDSNLEYLIHQKQTMGSLCTALLAVDLVLPQEKIVIAGANSVVLKELSPAMNNFIDEKVAAGVITFESTDSRFSYVRVDENGLVREIAEKRIISNQANTGIFYFECFDTFKYGAEWALVNSVSTNSTFYPSHSLSKLILDGKKVKNCPVGDLENYRHL
jgi:hypothetical protein